MHDLYPMTVIEQKEILNQCFSLFGNIVPAPWSESLIQDHGFHILIDHLMGIIEMHLVVSQMCGSREKDRYGFLHGMMIFRFFFQNLTF